MAADPKDFEGHSDHIKFVDVKKLHHPTGGHDGACLSRHQYPYEAGNSCSYRWQGAEVATTTDADLYQYVDGSGSVVNYLDKTQFPNNQSHFQSHKFPFDNQVHHLVSVSPVVNAILKISEPDPSKIEEAIFTSLRTHLYNINHFKNMMPLPMEAPASRKLGLPTHKGSHPTLNTLCDAMVAKAFVPFESMASQVVAGDHPDPKPQDINVRPDLETISDEFRSIIRAKAVAKKAKNANRTFKVDNLLNKLERSQILSKLA